MLYLLLSLYPPHHHLSITTLSNALSFSLYRLSATLLLPLSFSLYFNPSPCQYVNKHKNLLSFFVNVSLVANGSIMFYKQKHNITHFPQASHSQMLQCRVESTHCNIKCVLVRKLIISISISIFHCAAELLAEKHSAAP